MALCSSITTTSTIAATSAASVRSKASEQLVQWRWDAPRRGVLQCITSPKWSAPLPTADVLRTLLSHAGSRFEWRRSHGVIVRFGARELHFESPEVAVRALLANTPGDADASALESTNRIGNSSALVPTLSSAGLDPFRHRSDHLSEDGPLVNSALSSRVATPCHHAIASRSNSAASWSHLLDEMRDCSTPRMRSAMHSISASRIGVSRSVSCGPQGFGSESADI